MKDIVSVHLGDFGIKMANYLYPSGKSEKAKAILADISNEKRCAKKWHP